MALRVFSELYHMTHYSNLPSILERGLLSHNSVAASKIGRVDISEPNVQDLRVRKEPVFHRPIHDYVPLYFNPRNPMLCCRQEMQHEIVILRITDELDALGQSVLFTDGNAASRDTLFSNDVGVVIPSMDVLNAKRWDKLNDGKRRRCAEVLVPDRLDARHITGIACYNQALAKTLATRLSRQVTVDPALYFEEHS